MKPVIKAAMLVALILTLTPEYVQAQWPPFKFEVFRSYENGQATYYIEFQDRVDWQMVDLEIKVPLPKGTRFVEASAIPTIETGFDGQEIRFFASSIVNGRIKKGDAYFIIEILDPTIDILTIQPWISWQGEQPGTYLFEKIELDTSRQPLNWDAPVAPRLQLNPTTKIEGKVITYFINPVNIRGGRMWDVEINAPIPEGTKFLSAQAPPPFVSNFTGQEISFSTIELARRVPVETLSFKVLANNSKSPVTTHLWATWKNTGKNVIKQIVSQEETRTGDITVQPGTSQQLFPDAFEDVPFAAYDITNVILQDVILQNDNEQALKVNFTVAGNIGPVGEPLSYKLYIDQDCNLTTGQKRDSLGREYEISYNHKFGYAVINRWDAEINEWVRVRGAAVVNPINTQTITMWVPYSALGGAQSFCWSAEANYNTSLYVPTPPKDIAPDYEGPQLTQYVAGKATIETDEESFTLAQPSSGTFIDFGEVWQYMPGWAEPLSAWREIDFDDSSWFSGATEIGYGDKKFATDLKRINSSVQDDGELTLVQRVDKQSGMIIAVVPSGEEVDSVFIRRTFTVDTSLLTELTLDVRYQGGVVAYLNGIEVARRGFNDANQAIAYNSLAAYQESGRSREVFELRDYLDKLVDGVNVIAFQAHRAEDSSTLSIDPKLSWSFNPADILVDIPVPNSVTDTVVSSLTLNDIKGKLAVPIDNGRALYNIHIFSMPDGQEIANIANARQPNFRFDGKKLLINHEGGGVENVFEYDMVDGTEKQVSDAPQDWHPFYDPQGGRVVYGNSELTVGSPVPLRDQEGNLVERGNNDVIYVAPRSPFIFVQCSLLPPHQEADPRCRNIAWLGVLVPAGQTGEIQGTHPVWTTNDMIAYKGCNTWAGSSLCGIYIVPSASTKGFSNGFIPRQLTRNTSDIPSDTKGNWIAFMSQRDGDWEAYIMDLNGENVKNLSNSPSSNDGLPTISPDGNWVAFVSDRGGQWAVWVIPILGGEAQNLFDLPADIPWGSGNYVWTNERISWGP